MLNIMAKISTDTHFYYKQCDFFGFSSKKTKNVSWGQNAKMALYWKKMYFVNILGAKCWILLLRYQLIQIFITNNLTFLDFPQKTQKMFPGDTMPKYHYIEKKCILLTF